MRLYYTLTLTLILSIVSAGAAYGQYFSGSENAIATFNSSRHGNLWFGYWTLEKIPSGKDYELVILMEFERPEGNIKWKVQIDHTGQALKIAAISDSKLDKLSFNRGQNQIELDSILSYYNPYVSPPYDAGLWFHSSGGNWKPQCGIEDVATSSTLDLQQLELYQDTKGELNVIGNFAGNVLQYRKDYVTMFHSRIKRYKITYRGLPDTESILELRRTFIK